MLILTIQPATPALIDKIDGTGYELRTASSGHRAQLQIGNVSVAFDHHNYWRGQDGYSGTIMEFSENADDPVRVDGVSCPKCADVAETIFFALAADLGYTVSK